MITKKELLEIGSATPDNMRAIKLLKEKDGTVDGIKLSNISHYIEELPAPDWISKKGWRAATRMITLVVIGAEDRCEGERY